MHIVLTGGTGLIGRQLCHHWLEQGHRLTVWSRRPEDVAKICGAQVRGVARLEEITEPVDAVVNLAGAPIADRPWSHKRSEEHTSELQSLMRISYAGFCLKKKKKQIDYTTTTT